MDVVLFTAILETSWTRTRGSRSLAVGSTCSKRRSGRGYLKKGSPNRGTHWNREPELRSIIFNWEKCPELDSASPEQDATFSETEQTSAGGLQGIVARSARCRAGRPGPGGCTHEHLIADTFDLLLNSLARARSSRNLGCVDECGALQLAPRSDASPTAHWRSNSRNIARECSASVRAVHLSRH